MSEALLREILESIVKEQFANNIYIYIILCLLAGFGSFIGSYCKKRGENFATKADFDELLSQLRETTKATEEIKKNIAHEDWATREWKTLKRLKLEELFQSIHETEEWLNAYRNFNVFNSGKEPSTSPLANVERLTCLFFPELDKEISLYTRDCRQEKSDILDLKLNLFKHDSDGAGHIEIRQKFLKEYQEKYFARLDRISALEAKGRALMANVIGEIKN